MHLCMYRTAPEFFSDMVHFVTDALTQAALRSKSMGYL
jgi:hypothetical protein